MNRKTKINIFFISILLVIGIGGIYLLFSFLKALAPPKVLVSRNSIRSSNGFQNGFAIQKLSVDSIGGNQYPVKYTVVYSTSCKFYNSEGSYVPSPNYVEFDKNGLYSWDEDTGHLRYDYTEMTKRDLDSLNSLWRLRRVGKHSTCPIEIVEGQWYLFTVDDPRVTGIFYHIDSLGKEVQYFVPSGVSPI
jgi:hypothetical protein